MRWRRRSTSCARSPASTDLRVTYRRDDPHVARDRRRRLHRLQLRAAGARRRLGPSSTSTSSPTPATSRTWPTLGADPEHVFVHGDIGDRALVGALLRRAPPRAIVNFAAESHVDRSIDGPAAFVADQRRRHARLLDAAREHWRKLGAARAAAFRFLHVSTDEVYGSLGPERSGVHREDALRAQLAVRGVEGGGRPPGARLPPHLRPADADHELLEQLRAAQFPEKLIPLMILNALAGKPLPVYGDGGQRARLALRRATTATRSRRCSRAGRPGETYNVGGDAERTNLEVVNAICAHPRRAATATARRTPALDRASSPTGPGTTAATRSTPPRSRRELGWRPQTPFETGLRRTVALVSRATTPGCEAPRAPAPGTPRGSRRITRTARCTP